MAWHLATQLIADIAVVVCDEVTVGIAVTVDLGGHKPKANGEVHNHYHNSGHKEQDIEDNGQYVAAEGVVPTVLGTVVFTSSLVLLSLQTGQG